MNIGNEPSNPGGLGSEAQADRNKPQPLRPEEIQAYKDCISGLYYKAGIPFAIFCQALSSYLSKPGTVDLTPKGLFKRGFIFVGNVVLGTFLLTPMCYNKIKVMREEFNKRNEIIGGPGLTMFEGTQPASRAEDFNYSTDAFSNLNVSDDTYSTDFRPSSILSDDLDSIKTPTTTYQELRAQHRKTYKGDRGFPSILEPESKLGSYTPPFEKPVLNEPPQPPPKITRKNIYGDEI